MKEKLMKNVVAPLMVTGFFVTCSIAGNLWATVIKDKIYRHAAKKAAEKQTA